MLCAAANLLSVAADHCDWRDNEHDHKRFARRTRNWGFGLYFLAVRLKAVMWRPDRPI